MFVSISTALVMLAQGPAPDAEVAYASMRAGDDHLAIEKIETNSSIDETDPAKLINLGVAYARSGNELLAREHFEAAAASPVRYNLETANGDWVDSRRLAMKALRKLDRGEFRPTTLTQR
jgi:Flp pilus assembly protein TadD